MFQILLSACAALRSGVTSERTYTYFIPFKCSLFKFKKKLYVLLTQLYLCVLCGSENKQRLFPYTTLTGWFV